MATILENDFNSYDDGDLNGQGDPVWSGSAVFDIQGVLTYEGTKAVKATPPGASQFIEKSGNQLSEGKISMYLRKSSANNGNQGVKFKEGVTDCFVIGLVSELTGDKWGWYDSGGWHASGITHVANTWALLEVEWREDAGNPQFRWRIDGGAWQGWYDCAADWITGLNKISFWVEYYIAPTDMYFDHIAEEPYVPPPPVFPDAIYAPRTKENKAGIIYDETKKTIGYAEDVTKLDTEVVAIEDFLLPQHIFAHEDNVIPVAVPGTFIDVPFDKQASTPKVGIEHSYLTNPEQFKIKKTGVYMINWALSFSDSAVVPDSHLVTRIVKNGVEIPGSLLEKDIAGGPQQDKDKNITNSILVTCEVDDILKLQFTADDLTVSLDSHATYGDHKDTATINIIRIA